MTPARRDPIPPLEWLAAAIGLLIAIGLIAIIAREGVVAADDPVPQLTVTVGQPIASPGRHVVPIRVQNFSSRTAASVQVKGELVPGGGEPEESGTTIDYAPGHSEAAGGLIFTSDPRQGRLEVRIVGYEIP
jgi:uncharacterized protein (TIGR02588 family)